MPLYTRQALKEFFRKGKFPSEIHFSNLIESTVNKLDDGFAKSGEDGLQLAPQGEFERLLSFFEHINDPHPEWLVNLKDVDSRKGLSFESIELDAEGKPQGKSLLFFDKLGRAGFNTVRPRHLLDVNGTVGMRTRVGTYLAASVPGDGNWHPILKGLKGLHAFEIVARIDGPAKRGKYAFSHAYAVSVYGRSRSKIRHIRAHYGWFWNRISLRWKSNWVKNDTGGGEWVYELQIRTRSNYGFVPQSSEIVPIKFHITSLWDDNMEFPSLYDPPTTTDETTD